MSNMHYNNDLLNVLELNEICGNYRPTSFPGTDSCIMECRNSKGRHYMNLKHRSMGVMLAEINVGYNRYTCPVCSHYWKEDVPFKVKGHMMTALSALLFHFMENTAMAVIARLTGISAPTVYRLLYDNIEVPHRTYHLPSVLSIDEFRATSDEGTFAFHITNPITGKTLDIVSDRTMSTLLDYFSRFSHEQKKKVKIVVMDLLMMVM